MILWSAFALVLSLTFLLQELSWSYDPHFSPNLLSVYVPPIPHPLALLFLELKVLEVKFHGGNEVNVAVSISTPRRCLFHRVLIVVNQVGFSVCTSTCIFLAEIEAV